MLATEMALGATLRRVRSCAVLIAMELLLVAKGRRLRDGSVVVGAGEALLAGRPRWRPGDRPRGEDDITALTTEAVIFFQVEILRGAAKKKKKTACAAFLASHRV